MLFGNADEVRKNQEKQSNIVKRFTYAGSDDDDGVNPKAYNLIRNKFSIFNIIMANRYFKNKRHPYCNVKLKYIAVSRY